MAIKIKKTERKRRDWWKKNIRANIYLNSPRVREHSFRYREKKKTFFYSSHHISSFVSITFTKIKPLHLKWWFAQTREREKKYEEKERGRNEKNRAWGKRANVLLQSTVSLYRFMLYEKLVFYSFHHTSNSISITIAILKPMHLQWCFATTKERKKKTRERNWRNQAGGKNILLTACLVFE